ncbi:MAG: response regulator [Dermatophilaceae bacterium]
MKPTREVPAPIRVLVADDHALFRRGLRAMLELEGDIEVVGEAGDGLEAVVLAEELAPDVVLLDVRMPRSSGIEACQAIRDRVPAAKIVILTGSDEETDLFEAVRAGANGYVLKDVSGDQVALGIRAVYSGDSLISPSMASKLLAEFAVMRRRDNGESTSALPKLTEREVEVLGLAARGMGNREIGKTLFISENTVKNHVRNILEKLQLHSRMEAVMYAVRQNLIEPPRG